MARTQGAALDRKKLMGDPILVTTIVVLITFLTLFILYPLAILLVDSFVGDGGFSFNVFKRIFQMPTFTHAITNTLKVGFPRRNSVHAGGLLFAYVEVYVAWANSPVDFQVVSAAGRVPAVRAQPFDDHALRQGWHHHPLPAEDLR